MFEGIALGTRIAALGSTPAAARLQHIGHHHVQPSETPSGSEDTDIKAPGVSVSMSKKLLLAAAFAVVTPLGMAIGIGVLNSFNGNDPSTIVAIGTLDALSAGILVWVGIVEMWAHDWTLGGEMTRASPVKTALGMTGLVAGMAVMSLLGKWA
jgi:zinc transporter 1/2/3